MAMELIKRYMEAGLVCEDGSSMKQTTEDVVENINAEIADAGWNAVIGTGVLANSKGSKATAVEHVTLFELNGMPLI